MKKTHKVNVGEINRGWKYSKNPRVDGLIKMLKSAPIEYTNISDEYKYLRR